MPKPIAFLVFLITEILLLPISLTGALLFMIKLLPSRRAGISGTAYEPLWGRWMLHKVGARHDEACEKLLLSLPATSPLIMKVAMGPTFLAMRLSGHTPALMVYPAAHPSTITSLLPHRTEFFDTALFNSLDRVKQLVVLGAGWDTRAYSLPRDSEVRVFEVDTIETQRAKRRALQDAGVDTGHLAYVATDFNTDSWLERLKRHGFDPEVPAFFLWEGVIYYLETEAVYATLDTISQQCAGGSVIAFDYFGRDFTDDDGPLASRLFARAIGISHGEPWIFGVSTEPPAREQVANLLAAHGLALVRYEAMGKESANKKPMGGFVVAVSAPARTLLTSTRREAEPGRERNLGGASGQPTTACTYPG